MCCLFTANACVLSCVRLFATPGDRSPSGAPSMEFPRQEDWSELLLPPSGDLPDPGLELASLALAGGLFTTALAGKPILLTHTVLLEQIFVCLAAPRLACSLRDL